MVTEGRAATIMPLVKNIHTIEPPLPKIPHKSTYEGNGEEVLSLEIKLHKHTGQNIPPTKASSLQQETNDTAGQYT
jgi:hypothetical protein